MNITPDPTHPTGDAIPLAERKVPATATPEPVAPFTADEEAGCRKAVDSPYASFMPGSVLQFTLQCAFATLDAARAKLAEVTAERDALLPYREAIHDAAVVIDINPDGDPRDVLDRVLCWHRAVALDPRVSRDAAKLRDTYKAEWDRWRERCERAEALLPKTADGVAIVPGTAVFGADGTEDFVSMVGLPPGSKVCIAYTRDGVGRPLYSSRLAAEAVSLSRIGHFTAPIGNTTPPPSRPDTQCYRCKKWGHALDEFTSPLSGLCADCERARDAAGKGGAA